MTEMDYKAKLTRADVDVLNGSINRQVRSDPLADTMVKVMYKAWLWKTNPASAEIRGISQPAGYETMNLVPE